MELLPLVVSILLLTALSSQSRYEAVIKHGEERMEQGEDPPDGLEQDDNDGGDRELNLFHQEERMMQREGERNRDTFQQEQNDYSRPLSQEGDYDARLEKDGDSYRDELAMREEDDDDNLLLREVAMMQSEGHSQPPKGKFEKQHNPDDFREAAVVQEDSLLEELAEQQSEGHSQPPKSPKKITFEENTDMEALIERIAQSAAYEGEEGEDDEDDDAMSQWVMVTAEGYQHEASQDEIAEVLRQTEESTAKITEFTEASMNALTDQMKMQVSSNTTAQRVIGGDNRFRVRNPNRYPYSAMGRLQSGCSGTFIGPRHILTAGHCVFNPYSHRWIRNLKFQRAKDCRKCGYYHYWKYAVTVWGWIYGRRNYDYAVIVVRNPSPSWLSFGWRNPMPRYYVNTAGYPIDKRYGCLWQSHCRLGARYHTMMTYSCDTYNGMSGSPVYTHYRFWHFRFSVVYGIHVGSGKNLNLSVRINKRRYNTLRHIIRRYR